MISEPVASSELIEFVLDWFRLIARGHGDVAVSQLDGPNHYGIQWTLPTLSAAIEEAFPLDCRFRRSHARGLKITNPDEIADAPRSSMRELGQGKGFFLAHAVPLNGDWSDLSALFEFARRPNGLAVILEDLHVL